MPEPRNTPSQSRWWWGNESPALFFGLKLVALMAVYYAVVLVPVFDRMLLSYLSWNAWIANALLRAAGEGTRVSDVTISSARYAINVRRGCDAIEPAWFFCSAVLAFPARVGPKIRGMLLGVCCILAVNVVRIASLFLIGLHAPRFFRVAHLEIWPVVFILLAAFLWIGWISRVRRTQKHAQA